MYKKNMEVARFAKKLKVDHWLDCWLMLVLGKVLVAAAKRKHLFFPAIFVSPPPRHHNNAFWDNLTSKFSFGTLRNIPLSLMVRMGNKQSKGRYSGWVGLRKLILAGVLQIRWWRASEFARSCQIWTKPADLLFDSLRIADQVPNWTVLTN